MNCPVNTDPVYVPLTRPGLFAKIMLRALNDPRDLPFARLMVLLTVTLWPAAVYLAWPGNFRWWLAAPYLVLVNYFLGPFILMLHNTSHRKLFNRRFGWLNSYVPWVLGPLFGESPETYSAHHVGMHHQENNLKDDISSTMAYQRDSVVDFSRYFLRFFFVGLGELVTYFARRRRFALMRRTIVGEVAFFLAIGLLMAVSWRAALVILVVPLVVTRFAMMAGNWAQHAFIDPSAPENNFKNSITCINCSYNRRCFNDGYHIGHHLKRTRHWTEMPVEFVQNRSEYAAQGAIVFQGVDFFALWFFLMLKRYDWLAARFVQLGNVSQSPEEIETLLRSRTRRFEAPAVAVALRQVAAPL